MNNKHLIYPSPHRQTMLLPQHPLSHPSAIRFAHLYGACFAALNELRCRTNCASSSNLCRQAAFTLAEVVAVILILGIVAAMIIPSTIRRNIEISNRTKLKKALSAYNTLIEKAIIENDLPRSTNGLNDWGNSDGNCTNVRSYFKIIETGDNSCQFRTSDGVWWDFGANPNGASTSKALVAFKKENLNKATAIDESSNDAFFLMTQFDRNGAARVLDMAYSNYTGSSVNILNNSKIYAFTNKRKMSDYITYCGKDQRKSCVLVTNGVSNYYNENGKNPFRQENCNDYGLGCTSTTTGIHDDNVWKEGYNENDYTAHVTIPCDSQGDKCGCKEGNNKCRVLQYVDNKTGNDNFDIPDVKDTGLSKIPMFEGCEIKKGARWHQYSGCNNEYSNCIESTNENLTNSYKVVGKDGKDYEIRLFKNKNGTYDISIIGSRDTDRNAIEAVVFKYSGCNANWLDCKQGTEIIYTKTKVGYKTESDSKSCKEITCP